MSYQTPHGETLLSLKELAERVSFGSSDESIQRTARQIRHWTQNDLLQTYTGKGTGTGIPRLYLADPTLTVAGVLIEVARYGATIDTMRPISEALYDIDDYAGQYHQRVAETYLGIAYLQLSWENDPVSGKLVNPEVHFFNTQPHETLPDIREGYPDEDPSSSILVNLNSVMDRVGTYRR